MSFDEFSSSLISTNVVWHHAIISKNIREKRNGHRGAVIWFTGLSGSGKSTLAHALEEQLFNLGCHSYVLDGDNVRHGLCGDLGFSPHDRQENIRRVGEVSKLFVEAGVIILTAFISPFQADRDLVRSLFSENVFIEVFCDAQLDICESRDVKGLYKKARNGEIADFTGISSPYEAPNDAEITIDTGTKSLVECVNQIMNEITQRGIYSPPSHQTGNLQNKSGQNDGRES